MQWQSSRVVILPNQRIIYKMREIIGRAGPCLSSSALHYFVAWIGSTSSVFPFHQRQIALHQNQVSMVPKQHRIPMTNAFVPLLIPSASKLKAGYWGGSCESGLDELVCLFASGKLVEKDLRGTEDSRYVKGRDMLRVRKIPFRRVAYSGRRARVEIDDIIVIWVGWGEVKAYFLVFNVA